MRIRDAQKLTDGTYPDSDPKHWVQEYDPKPAKEHESLATIPDADPYKKCYGPGTQVR
jgi:hypothetical protein